MIGEENLECEARKKSNTHGKYSPLSYLKNFWQLKVKIVTFSDGVFNVYSFNPYDNYDIKGRIKGPIYWYGFYIAYEVVTTIPGRLWKVNYVY